MTTAAKIAAVLPVARVLLPPNATLLEHALLAAELARLADVDPEVLRTIWNPQLCPALVLPYLAWATSVDVWDNDWPESIKRDVIAAAPEVHRRKGTRASLDRALVAMRLSAGVKEWWQRTPNAQRGTFAVTVFVNDHVFDPTLPILTEQVQKNALATVRATKPKSRSVTFALGVGFKDGLLLANRASSLAIDRRKLKAAPDLTRKTSLGLANLTAGLGVDHRALEAAPDLVRRSRIGLAGRFAGMAVHHQSFVVEGA